MSPQVIGLLVLAGLVHSLGNLLAKRGEDSQAFLWLVLAVAAIAGFIPFLILARPLPAAGWALVALSGALEALYYVLLGSAYQAGDFSLVYPLARGSAPLFATMIALPVLREHPSWAGAAGILLIVCGIYALHMRAFARADFLAPLAAMRSGISRLALLIGLVIASYSVVDKIGVTYTNPMAYLYLILAVAAILLAPYMLAARGGAVRREWAKHRWRILTTAVFFVGAYLLVLFAFQTTQVGYVSSVREIAVVFGALLGVLVLREPLGQTKVLGALLIFAGILAIGLGA